MMLTDHSSKLTYINRLAGVEISVEELENYSLEELLALASEIKSEIAVIKTSIAGHEMQLIAGVTENEEKQLKLSTKKMEVAKRFKQLFLERVYQKIKTIQEKTRQENHRIHEAERLKAKEDLEQKKRIRMQSWERRFVESAREMLPEEVFQSIVDEVTRQECDR